MDQVEYERREAICTEAAMSQWERSLKRPDLTEKDRVRGAIEAYKRQAFAFNVMVDLQPRLGTSFPGNENFDEPGRA